LSERHYDVVVLGRSLGALTAAALLARRDFRVLVLGQGARPPSYRFARHTLRRSALTMLFGSSPLWKRVLVELAQTQTFRRRVELQDPMVQLLMPGHRLDVPADIRLFEKEILREFPDVRRVIDDLYASLARTNAAVDAVFEREAVWPPGTFWERRETGKLIAALPYVHRDADADLLGDLAPLHPYRDLAALLLSFASNLVVEALPSLAEARLHGSWARGISRLAGGEEELGAFLLERVQAHGGTCRLDERASRIYADRSGVTALLVDGESVRTSARFVVSDGTGEQLAELAQGQGVQARAEREWPDVKPQRSRFVMSVVLREDGVPPALGRELMILPERADGIPLHVVRMDPRNEDGRDSAAPAETLLVVEALIPHGEPAPLAGVARERLLASLREVLPFLDEHLVVVDSPHDGRPLFHYAGGPAHQLVERIHLQGATTAREPMATQWRVGSPSFFDLAGEPIRGPIGRTLLVGSSVLPALGQEGQLLSAWSAVRIVTRADGQKERIRRAMWNKVDLG
jgi:phytoene dehydrogenase-like protein